VFLTAKVQAAERRRLEELGAAGVVAKPFDPMTLAGELSSAFGWS
jgi:CheY-like chemotaxis protein